MASEQGTTSARVAAPHGARLRVLLVDPDPSDRARLERWLAARDVALRACGSRGEALAALAESGADVIVMAGEHADMDAIVTANAAPVIVLGEAGVHAPDAVIPRSVPPAAVLVVIEEVVRGRATAAPPAPTLPELLVALRALGETGVVELRAHGLCSRILIRDGAPVFAEGGALRETLGRLLLRRGALSEADYVRVIERMTQRLIENEATRMGEVLVELGLLTPQEVFEALSEQVREKILGCFRWERFEYHFEPRSALPADVLAYRCPPVEALLLAGLREHFAGARLEPLLRPACGAPARLRSSPEQIAMLFQATPAEQRLLHDLDGTRTVETLRSKSPLGALHAGQLLAALVVADAIELEPPSAPARARAHPAAPRAAPPPRLHASAPRSLSQLRRELARAGKVAPAAQAAPEARSAPIDAEHAFRQGLALLAQPALPGAQRAFARACELRPDEPEYAMLDAWVQFLLAKDAAARSAAREVAAANARRLLRHDPDSVRAHGILGQLAIGAGALEVAERHFRHALRIAADDRDALRGMRTVERRRSELAAHRSR